MSSKVVDLIQVTTKEQVLKLRISGKDTREIAQELLISEVEVRNLLNESWTSAAAQINKYAELIVAFDIQRLETLIDKLMIMAIDQDSLNAIDRLIKLINLKSKLLQKEAARPVTSSISGHIHHTHEQVFGVNNDEYTMAVQELMKDPTLVDDHPKLNQIQAKLQAFNIAKGTPQMDEVVEGTFEMSDDDLSDFADEDNLI